MIFRRQVGPGDKRNSESRSCRAGRPRTAQMGCTRGPIRRSRRTEGGAHMGLKGRSKIFPHLWYAKEAEEAAKFYASIFPDSRVDGVTSLQSDSPSGPAGSVKVVEFTLFGQRFQAMSAGPHHDFNDAISMVVLCDDQAELDRYWKALLRDGGKPQACGW